MIVFEKLYLLPINCRDICFRQIKLLNVEIIDLIGPSKFLFTADCSSIGSDNPISYSYFSKHQKQCKPDNVVHLSSFRHLLSIFLCPFTLIYFKFFGKLKHPIQRKRTHSKELRCESLFLKYKSFAVLPTHT